MRNSHLQPRGEAARIDATGRVVGDNHILTQHNNHTNDAHCSLQ